MSRPAPYANPLTYAEEALASPRGILVNCGTRRVARNLRMNFYAKRAEAREAGELRYDDLIVLVEEMNVVFKKQRVTTPKVEAL
jgi:hypothetical protein